MRRQRGVTMIGWIFLLIPVVLVGYAGLRAGPKYMDYYKIVTAMKETASQLKSDETLTAQTIRFALDKRFDTGYVDNLTAQQVEVSKGENGWEMTADYDENVPLFGNLSLQMNFNKTVVID